MKEALKTSSFAAAVLLLFAGAEARDSFGAEWISPAVCDASITKLRNCRPQPLVFQSLPTFEALPLRNKLMAMRQGNCASGVFPVVHVQINGDTQLLTWELADGVFDAKSAQNKRKG